MENPQVEGWADPASAALPVSSEPCAFTSTLHLCAQPSNKGVSCSMAMLKGKVLLYLLGMNLFERGKSPGGQGSFATEHSPHQDFVRKEGTAYFKMFPFVSVQTKLRTQLSTFLENLEEAPVSGYSTAQVSTSCKERLYFLSGASVLLVTEVKLNPSALLGCHCHL